MVVWPQIHKSRGYSSIARIRRCRRRDVDWSSTVRTNRKGQGRGRPHTPPAPVRVRPLHPHGSVAQLAEHPVLTREVARSRLARFTNQKPGSSSSGAPLLQSGGWQCHRGAQRRQTHAVRPQGERSESTLPRVTSFDGTTVIPMFLRKTFCGPGSLNSRLARRSLESQGVYRTAAHRQPPRN